VNDADGNAAVALEARSEYHDPVAATLCTTTLWVPAIVPLAAVAVTEFELDDETVRADIGPVRLLSAARSALSVVVAV